MVGGQVILSLSHCLKMGPRPRCPICLSRRWRKDPTSGLIVCSEGHVFEVHLCPHATCCSIHMNEAQNYRNETNERDEQLNHALKKRTIKARKSVGGFPSNANPSRQFVPFRPAPDGLNVLLQITTENVPTFIISPACKSCSANKWQPSPNYGHSLQSLRRFLETYGLWL